jgi:hypothetical protein
LFHCFQSYAPNRFDLGYPFVDLKENYAGGCFGNVRGREVFSNEQRFAAQKLIRLAVGSDIADIEPL